MRNDELPGPGASRGPSELLSSLEDLTRGVKNPLTNLANAAALFWEALADINWAGFYLLDSGELWLGPFHGRPACTRIGMNKGVCGSAFSQDRTLIVADVHAFPGHVACDAASRSEIVVPLRAGGHAIGVLDIDSPHYNRFGEQDQFLLEAAVQILETNCDFTRCGYNLQPQLKDDHA